MRLKIALRGNLIIQTTKSAFGCFVVLSYIIFIVLFLIIGISMMFGAPESITNLLQIIAAWSSTFAFIILFKKIYPGLRLKDFVKQQFAPKVKFSVLSSVFILQIIIIGITIFLLSTSTTSTEGAAISYTSMGILSLVFFDQFVRGPLGEELGWRGYALNELQKKHSPLSAAFIIGVLWGFWHMPLWFASGYTGIDLIKYIVLFMIGIISFSIIVTLFYNLNNNLLIPIVAHQIFNFSLVIIRGDLLDILVYVMLFYFVVALLFVVINPKHILYKKSI
ncbi:MULTISPECIES: CPBP family intramembrane glutamic endopeptidase [Oceanobacillus]|uniref:CPBP family intramembrane glutamic endopeptidase n=2 Tax=Bacillaceae TaxID=186817 RepID=A0ABV9JVU0_9BACI|nr:CPBP family intramembrane glutamic endopeptidase [Oceanobacillus oncorhynchi]MDM8102688.1 CPBP family intramembrane metalloprotease [Oceanobacillus oncorhynchi]